MQKRGKDLEKLKAVVKKLAEGDPLDAKHHDHPLIGPQKNCRDCHIEPDWVLIYHTDAHVLTSDTLQLHLL